MGLKKHIWLLVLSIWLADGPYAQGLTEQFVADIQVKDAHSATVICTITVVPDSGVTMLPLQAIKYENASITAVRVDDQAAEIIDYNHLWKVEHYGFSGSTITVEYDVMWQGEEAVIPVLYVPWKTQDTEEGKMAVTISLPPNTFIGNHFPDVTFTKNEGWYAFNLPVVTSLVKFDLREDEDFYISGTTVVDFLIICLLAGLGVIGWKRRKMLA